jgi:Raf kinase inhibitor-like YbhB/YbcL family protein
MARLNVQDLRITSPDFTPGSALHDRHCANGGSTLPRLQISGVPENAVELAVICHDPDAPLADGFTHLTLYGIPASVTEISPENVGEFRSGPNGTGGTGFYGPQPPAGHGVHHYYFWVYALKAPVEGAPSREEFLQRYAEHIVEQNRVIGTFENAG